METFKDIMRLVRWSNLLFLGALVWVMEKWVAVPVLDAAGFGEQLPGKVLLLMGLAIVLIAAGGYVINDYFDVKIDRINRPDEVVVTRSISKHQAFIITHVLFYSGAACGMAASAMVRCGAMGIIFLIVPGMLWFYSSSYKRLFMVGNVVIALVSCLPPLMIAMANISFLRFRFGEILPYTTLVHDLYAWLGGFALFAFLLSWAREIVKDMQDVMGDRELECHTMPVVMGEKRTKVFVTALLVVILALIGYFWFFALPFPTDWDSLSTRYIVLGIVIPLLSSIWLLWSAGIPSEYRTCQRVIKLAMLFGMLYSICIVRGL